jgi:hypothetical protein
VYHNLSIYLLFVASVFLVVMNKAAIMGASFDVGLSFPVSLKNM